MKLGLLYVVIAALASAEYQPNWNSLDKRPLPEWYDEAKLGIFIVWGLYSVPSYGGGLKKGGANGEWFWYEWVARKEPWAIEFMEKNYPPGFTFPDFAPMFKAELYDPAKWASLIEQSGAKYTVLATKHHSGWCNWPTKTAWNWNAMDTGPHRDLVGDLAAAVKNTTKVHFGVYFSQFEWFNPLYLQDKNNGFKTQTYVEQVSLPQMHELVNMYKPDVMFSDGDWDAPDTYWNSTEFLTWLYNESPVKDTVVVNDRWGNGCHCQHGGYYSCNDRFNPRKLQNHKWENAMTIDKYSWGFRREATLDDYLSIEEILEEFVTTVSCGGNMLMNVGPTHDGRIVPVFEERLLQLGSWLKINGEAIYHSKPWTHQNDSVDDNVWYTKNVTTNAIYAISLKWPDSYILTLGSVKTSTSTVATLLGYGKLQWKNNSNGQVEITMPYLPLDTPLQWAWTIKLENTTPTRLLKHKEMNVQRLASRHGSQL